MTKQNDIFAAILQQPNVNVFDLAASDITSSNTQLLTPEDYKKLPKVQQMFQTSNGKFDDAAFNLMYNKAAQMYGNISSDKALANALEYDPLDFKAPIGASKVNVNPVATRDYNPYKQYYSQTGVNSIDDNGLSLRELAQQSKIYDTEAGEWTDKSANDLNIFQSLFGSTLVYAQWDDDGVSLDPATGRTSKHKKGDWKLDKDGNFYIETLGNREVYGKQIVNPMDILTKEGTTINKIDFFDSDGKDKSTVGTVMKFAAEVAPYLIPGLNVYYGGVKMAMGLASVLPTFYKAGENALLGDNENGVESPMWKAMNSVEGYMSKYNTQSVSDESQGGMLNFEQLGNMISDTFSQIYEQRAAASLSKLFFKTKDADYLKKLTDIASKEIAETGLAKNEAIDVATKAIQASSEIKESVSRQSALAKALNLGYMALTQSADVYSDAIAGGYSRQAAGWAAWMAAAGQYGIMANNPMGDWFLDKATGYSENASRAEVRKVVNKHLGELEETMSMFKTDPTVAKKELGTTFSKIKNKISDIFTGHLDESSILENLWKRSVIEGVEEVTEQAVLDASKGMFDALTYTGFIKGGSFGGLSNVFSQKGLENYISNFVGGAIGGPMFELEHSVLSPLINNGSLSSETQANIYSLVAAGRANEIYDVIDKRKHRFGSQDLSPVATEINGEKVFLPTENISQSDMIAEQMKQHVKQIERIVETENLKGSDEDLIKRSIMNQIYIKDLTKSGVDRFVLSDLKDIGKDIVSISSDISTLQASKNETNVPEIDAKINEKRVQLDQKRKEYTDIIQGTKADYYHGLSLFSLNPILHTPFLSLSVDEFVKTKYNKDYYSLSDEDKDTYKDEFDAAMDNTSNNLKTRMKTMYNSFLAMNESFSKSLADYDSDGYASIRSRFYKYLHNVGPQGKISLYDALSRLNSVNRTLKEGGFQTHSLDSQTDLSVGKFLVDSGLIKSDANLASKIVAHSERMAKYAELLGMQKEENETQSDYEKRVLAETDKLLFDRRINESVNELIPGITDMNQYNAFMAISNSNLTPDVKEALTKNFTGFLSAIEQDKLYHEIADEHRDITPEDLAKFGVVSNPGDTQETLNAKFQELAPKIENTSDTLSNEKYSPFGRYAAVDKIEAEHKESLNKAKESNEITNQMIADELDSIGLPTTDFDVKALSEQINARNAEIEKSYFNEKARIDALPEGDEKKQQLAALALSYAQRPMFKLSEAAIQDNPIISVRDALLTKYAEDSVKDNVPLDNETISELEKLRNKYEKARDDAQDNFDYDLAEQLDDQFMKIYDILEKADRKTNSLYDKLRKFEVELYGWTGPASIFHILSENVNAFNQILSSSEFKRTDVQLAQLNKALSVVKAAKAVLGAMSSTEIKPGNLYGYNVSLNKALEKIGENPKYEILGSEASDVILKDINLIEDKLSYLKTLAEGNSATIVENQAKIQKALIDGLLSQGMNTKLPQSLVSLTLGGKPLLTKEDVDKINDIDNPELKLIELEHTFYTNFHKATGSLTEKLDEVFNQFLTGDNKDKFRQSLLNASDSELTEDFNKLESADWYRYVHYILASNSHNFYKDYENNVQKELSLSDRNQQKAPFFTQQFALRQVDAYFNSKDIVGHIVSFLQSDIEEAANVNSNDSLDEATKKITDEIGKIEKFPLKNIISVRGSGGTGKSSVLANWALRTLIDQKRLGETFDIWVSAPTQSTVDVLMKDIGKEINVDLKTKDKQGLFQALLTAEGYSKLMQVIDILSKNKLSSKLNNPSQSQFIDPKYFVIGEGSAAVVITDAFYNDFLAKAEGSAKVIAVDEMSKFSTLEWQILNKIAESKGDKSKGFYVMMMGDDLQNGINYGTNSFGSDNIFCPTTVKLKNPIRAKNVHKNNNNITLEDFVSKWRSYIYNNTPAPSNINLLYSERDGEYLAGDKIVDTLDERDLRKLDPNKEIAVITDKPLSDDNKDLLDKVFGKDNYKLIVGDVQGQEFDQAIIIQDIADHRRQYLESKNLYTLLSRAREASLFVGKTSFNINNDKVLYNDPFQINPDIILDSLKKRSAEISDLSKSFDRVEDIKPEEIKDKDTKEMDLVENQKDEGIQVEDQTQDVALDPNKSLAYSFFNNLGISNQSFMEFLDYTITENEDNDAQKLITWSSLLKRLGEDIGTTDLFNIEYFPMTSKTLKEVINEYVGFKNALLFNAIDTSVEKPATIFGSQFTESSDLLLKRIDNSEDKPLYSYGAIVNPIGVGNNMYAFGKYYTINGKKTFITLAIAPDENNKNVANSIDINKLQSIYRDIDRTENKEIKVDPQAITVYKGIQVPRNIDGSTEISPISVDEITNKIPGVTISEVRVFRNDPQFIRDEFRLYETSEISDDKRDYNKYRFRPYVIVSFADGSNKFKKLVVLQGKSRSLGTAWNELNDLVNKGKETNSKVNSAHIISKYRGWEVMYEFIKSLNNQDSRKEFVDHLNSYFMVTHNNQVKAWEPFMNVISKMASVDPNAGVTFKQFIEDNQGEIKNIITDVKDTQDLKIGNPFFLLHSLYSSSKFTLDDWNKFMENEGQKMQIYYNTVISSAGIEEAGSKYGLLSDDQKQYYTMNFALNPNKLLFDLDTLKLGDSAPKSNVSVDKVQVTPNSLVKTITISNDSDITSPVQYTVSLKPEDNPNVLINMDGEEVLDEDIPLVLETMDKTAKYNIESAIIGYEEGESGLFKFDEEGNMIPFESFLKQIYNKNSYKMTFKDGKIDKIVPKTLRFEDSMDKQTKCSIH